jgi:putative colanic acid biosynthesis glycosyltransferase
LTKPAISPEPSPPSRPRLFTVVTVCLNNRDGLRQTHRSLRRQSCRDFEWIVVDGGSQDDTVGYLEAHRDELAWWRSAPDRGLYDAMNIGLAAASGEYLIFLNAGDALAEPETLKTLAKQVEQGIRPDFIYGDALERGADDRLLVKRARSHHFKWYGMFAHHQAMVFRRELVEGQRYDLAWKIGADYAYTLDTLSKCVRVARVDAPLVLIEGGGLSQTHAALGRREQAEIRRSHLHMSNVSCFLIMLAQHAAISIRWICPTVFEKWRCQRMHE